MPAGRLNTLRVIDRVVTPGPTLGHSRSSAMPNGPEVILQPLQVVGLRNVGSIGGSKVKRTSVTGGEAVAAELWITMRTSTVPPTATATVRAGASPFAVVSRQAGSVDRGTEH